MPDSWIELFEVVRRNRLRTFLTMSGVFWGMFMLIMMLGFGTGLERGVQSAMGGFTSNAVYIWGQRTSMAYRGMQPGRNVGYDDSDVEALLREIPGIEYLCPRNQIGGYRNGMNVVRGALATNISVAGDTPNYRHVQPMKMIEGRWINALDMQGSRKVAVLGLAGYEALFEPGESALGEYVEVRGVAFQVVGVFKSQQPGDQGDRQEQSLHVPFTTFQTAFNYGDRVGWFAITGLPHIDASVLEADVRAALAERHQIHPEDIGAIGSYNSEKEYQKIQKLFGGIRFLVWFVGSATLLSGVVGVSNILLITVRERTAEIGVRRALGATQLQVVWMIVQEALLLTSVAGYSGLVAGVAMLELASLAIGEGSETMGPPSVDLAVALAAVVVLIIGGAFAGLIPAQRAASIQPVDALRS